MQQRLDTGKYSGDVLVTPAFGVKGRKPELGSFGASLGVDMRVQTNRRKDIGLTATKLDTQFNQGKDLIPFMAIKAWKTGVAKGNVQPYVKNHLNPPPIHPHDLKRTLESFYSPSDGSAESAESKQEPVAYSVKREELETLSSLASLDSTTIEPLLTTLSLQNASRKQLQKFNVDRMVSVFSRKDGDTGSPEVQGIVLGRDANQVAAVFTVKIMHLSDHLHRNKVKDKLAVRKRDQFIHKRRKILLYLKRTVRRQVASANSLKNLQGFVETCKALGVDPLSIVGSYKTAIASG